MYIGEWNNNVIEGYGEIYYIDDKIYKGFFKNNKKHGFGVFYWKNNDKVYLGFWKDGKQSNLGKYMTKHICSWNEYNDGKKIRKFKDKNEAYLLLNNSKEIIKYDKLYSLEFNNVLNFFNE